MLLFIFLFCGKGERCRLSGLSEQIFPQRSKRKFIFNISLSLIFIVNQTECMIRRVYIHIIAPLTIYLGRSFPHHVRSLSVTYSTVFFAVFYRVSFSEGFLGCVSSNNFESSPDRPSFVIRFYYPVQEYKESDA